MKKQIYEPQIVKIEKGNSGRFVKPFTVVYLGEDKKEYKYEMVSRHLPEQKIECDAVVVIPIVKQDNKCFVLLNRQYRYPIGKFSYEYPAGLIDAGESIEEAAARELEEETGAKSSHFAVVVPPSFVSPGMTDEKVAMVIAEVNSFVKPNREKNEAISNLLVETNKLSEFVNQIEKEAVVDFKVYATMTLVENYCNNIKNKGAIHEQKV